MPDDAGLNPSFLLPATLAFSRFAVAVENVDGGLGTAGAERVGGTEDGRATAPLFIILHIH